jgi:hypothetical protein
VLNAARLELVMRVAHVVMHSCGVNDRFLLHQRFVIVRDKLCNYRSRGVSGVSLLSDRCLVVVLNNDYPVFKDLDS